MKKILIILFVLAAFYKSPAQDTLGLHEILMDITHRSQHLQMFDAKINSEKEAAKGAYTWEAPQIGAGLFMAPYNPTYFKGMNGREGMGMYMISAEQMFPNKKRQDAEFNFMNAMSDVTKQNKIVTQNDLFKSAKKNFYEWMVLKKKTVVLEENERLIKFMIKTAELKYQNNTGDITSYYKAKAALGNIHNLQIQLKNEVVQKRIALNTLMHRDRMFAFEIDTNYVVKDFSTIEIDSLSILSSRSDIAAVNNEIKLTNLQTEVENQKLQPSFGLKYDHMMGLNMPMRYSIMAMVKIPFAKWSSKGIRANMESLKWKAISQEKEKEAVINEVLGEAYSIKSEIEERKKMVQVYEDEIIPALKRNYQTTQLAYEQNTEKLFVLYDAWESYNKIQLEYLDQLQQLLVLQAELERILEIKE